MKTHSMSQRVSEAPQTLRQDRLQQERNGNDQVHTNTSFANNQTHVAKRYPTSGCWVFGSLASRCPSLRQIPSEDGTTRSFQNHERQSAPQGMAWDNWKDCLQQEWQRKYELQILSEIIKTHSTGRGVHDDRTTQDFPSQDHANLASQTVGCTLRKAWLQRERDGNDPVHTNTSFANDQNSLVSKGESSATSMREKVGAQIIWRINKTHSTNQRVSETLQQDRLQQERDGNDQVHTKTSFANDQNSLVSKGESSPTSMRETVCAQIIWRIIKTHSTNQWVSETLQQDGLQQERDGNDQVHTNTTFTNDLNSLSYKEDDSGV